MKSHLFYLLWLILLPSLVSAHGQQAKALKFKEIKKIMLPDAQGIITVKRKLSPQEIKRLKEKGWRWNKRDTAFAWIAKGGEGKGTVSFILDREKTRHGVIGLAVGFTSDFKISKIKIFEYPRDEQRNLEYLIKKKNIFKYYLGRKIDVSSLKKGEGMAKAIDRAIVKSSLLIELLHK